MVYEIFIKNGGAPNTTFHTHDMEVARTIIKDKFIPALAMENAIDVCMDATETDTTKTGIIMSYRVKLKDQVFSGTVTAIPDEDFFIESYNSNVKLPHSFCVNSV